MFYNLHQTVTQNAVNVINQNVLVPAKHKIAATNDASGTIVDVLKAQLDNGNLKEVVKFFQTSGIENSFLISVITNKYASRLNNYYCINMVDAKNIADKLIPDVMKNFISVTKHATTKEQGVFSFLNWLSGNTINFEALFIKINATQFA